MRRRFVMAILLSLTIVVTAPTSAPVQAQSNCYVAGDGQTYCVDGLFRNFWLSNGEVPVFGIPISCEGSQIIIDPGRTGTYIVQWFERFRLENHVGESGLAPVELGRMGFEVLASEIPPRADLRAGTVTFMRENTQIPGCDYIDPFGHNICDPFKSKWHASGGLSKNGLPLSGVQSGESVPDPFSPGSFDVQWFERARFELHTNWPVNSQVGRGLLGNMLYYTGGDPRNPPKVSVSCSVRSNTRSQANFSNRGIKPEELAQDDTALYSQDGFVSMLFTPAASLPIVPAEDLNKQIQQHDLSILNRRPLAALTLVHSDDQRLPPDDYVLTIDANGMVVFTGAKTQPLQASVHSLPTPLRRPIAFVTAAQKCIAWSQTSVCADSPAPLSGDLLTQLKQAAEELGLNTDPSQSSIDFDQAVSLVVGADQLNACANALRGDQASYDQCQAPVLAAPATKDGVFPAPDDKGGPNIAIGILKVLKEIRDDVFADPELSQPIHTLPAGAYRVYDVSVDTNIKPANGVVVTSVRLSGPNGDFYLPSVNAAALRGTRVYGVGTPLAQDAAVAASLILRDRCFLRAGRCPGQLK